MCLSEFVLHSEMTNELYNKSSKTANKVSNGRLDEEYYWMYI